VSSTDWPFAWAVTVTPAGSAHFVAIARSATDRPALTVKPGAGSSSHTSGSSEQVTAAFAFRRPPVVVRPASDAFASEVRRRSAFRPRSLAAGKAAVARAAAPVTCGVAIDVPDACL
jgi:hypothetical protein